MFGVHSTGEFTQGHGENPLGCFWYIPSLGPSVLSLQLAGACVAVLVRKPCSAEQSL